VACGSAMNLRTRCCSPAGRFMGFAARAHLRRGSARWLRQRRSGRSDTMASVERVAEAQTDFTSARCYLERLTLPQRPALTILQLGLELSQASTILSHDERDAQLRRAVDRERC
jgi:hypothetical protein